ncbi:MAG: methyl-accepting chemotaxis protein, partial [Lysobacter sp.]|nr:methyl-accepting chemotaxis protein [Lysobacter sp.]
MSTMMEKGRSIGTTAWLGLLGLSVLLAAGNAGYAIYRSNELAGANGAAAGLQVLSQQLANQGREAVSGKPEAFTAFKATKASIENNVAELRNGFGNKPGVSGAIEKVATTWSPLGQSADQVVGAEKTVVEFAGHADKFNARVPQLQAQLDEVVRAMSAAGAPSSQVYIALRQVVLASTMAQRVTQIRAGGATASLAGDALKRDTDVFENVLKGLRDGGSANVQKLSNGAAISALGQASVLWTEMRKDLDAILAGSNNLFAAQSAAANITNGSDALLNDSRDLFGALTSSGSVKSTNLLGHPLLSLAFGLMVLFSIGGLLWSLYRQQQQRFETTKELNDRNQEAIMRLLDEMGSL